jgi:L-aspartate oxidase
MESNSNYAQGGIAGVMDRFDSFDKHITDTLEAGAFHNDKKAVEVLVKNAPKQIERLIKIGVGFSRDQGELALTQEGGHSHRRIAYAHDTTGKEIERALIHAVRTNPNISTFESHIAFELLMQDGVCSGALVFDDEKQEVQTFLSTATILATGGAGQVYTRNSNPKIATGDGIAMAVRAGAKTQDMEFIQFHPTALDKKNKPSLLISETVRGEGGVLVNSAGEKFMAKYHKLKDLAPRDIVARAILTESKHGKIYLDIRHKGTEYIKKRFPYLYNQLWWYGVKMDKDLIPISPAAHFICGGVHTDTHGQTNIPGLFAFGEVAHTGVHGANRLASNSLLECMVFSDRASKVALKYIRENKIQGTRNKQIKNLKSQKLKPLNLKRVRILKKKIQTLMWNNVGIVREEKKMLKTLQKLEEIKKEIQEIKKLGVNRDILELDNINTVAILITQSALARKESLGTHFML